MRTLFLLLVLANLLFPAYALVMREGARGEEQLQQLQIAPERIRLLRALEPASFGPLPAAALLGRVGGTKPCLEWGVLAGPAAARAEAALGALELPPAQLQRTVSEAAAYWVYMPPLKTKPEADRKVAELQALGIRELHLVQDTGPWRHAISLGIFRSEAAALAFLSALRERGVRTAVSARREHLLRQVIFHVREPSESTVARIARLQKDFPGTELKAAACPPPEG